MASLKKQTIVKNGNLFLIIAFIMMGILFFSSSQTYQQQSSIPFLKETLKGEPFKDFFSKITFLYGGSEVSVEHSGYFKFVEFFIRKGAHFFTYFVLGGSLFLGVKPKMKETWLVAILAWLSATGYAGLDEFHQMLTGGRTPLMQDVALDSSGALTAVCLCCLYYFIKRRRKSW